MSQNPFASSATQSPFDFGKIGKSEDSANGQVPGLDTSPTSLMFDMDLSNVEGGGSVPAGTYAAYLEKLEPGVTQGGDPKWVFYFRVIEHPNYAGRQVQDHCSNNALWKTKRNLAGLGVDVSGRARFDPEVLKGMLCVLVLTDPDAGQKFPNVEDVLPWPKDRGGPGSRFVRSS